MEAINKYSNTTNRAVEKQNKFRIRHIVWLVLFVVFVNFVWEKAHEPGRFPIHAVEIEGDSSHINKQAVQHALIPFLNEGFFGVDIPRIQHCLLRFPWVAKVDVSRIWPYSLRLAITEQTPVAQWGDNGLLNEQGELFIPPRSEFPSGLPKFEGSAGKQVELLQVYKALSVKLAPLGLHIVRITVSSRQAWHLHLNNGIDLILGQRDIEKRVERFIHSYQQIFDACGREVDYIDLRYPNGFAVHWKVNP